MLNHQQQTILRNSTSADAALKFLKLAWASRSKKCYSTRRPLPLDILAFVHMVAFLMATIFSATALTSLGDEFVVSSPNCGLLSSQTTDLSGIQDVFLPYSVKSLQESASCARSCYGTIATDDTWHDCSKYARSRLPSEQNTDASCPFSSSICTAPAFRLDTGLMISDQMFGMNARPRDSPSQRSRMC